MQEHNEAATVIQHGTFEAIPSDQARERRQHARAVVLAELQQISFVELGSTGGLLLDISEGGIAIQAAHSVEKGLRLGVKFMLPFTRYSVETTCAVAWSDGGHAGLKFAALSEVLQRDLKVWLQMYGAGRPESLAIEASPATPRPEEATNNESCTPLLTVAASANTAGCSPSSGISQEATPPRQDMRPELAHCDPGHVDDGRGFTIEGAIARAVGYGRGLMVDGANAQARGDGTDLAVDGTIVSAIDADISETGSVAESPRADRRATPRSLISVPMWARWTSDREHEMKVNSRDIGDGGIFFRVNSDVIVGTEVDVTFTLPSDPGADGNKRLHVKGTVIRTEHQGEGTGCALRITSSELLEANDIVTQARLAVRRVADNDFSTGQSRAARGHFLRLAYRLVAVIILACVAAVVGFLALHTSGPENAAAALREIVKAVTEKRTAAVEVPQSEPDAKPSPARTVRGPQRKASSSLAKHTARNPEPTAVQLHSAVGQPVQAETFASNNNNVLSLDPSQGNPVLKQGYIGEFSSPPTQNTSAATNVGTASATSNSTAVVLRVLVRGNGTVASATRASGPAELAPAAIAAIRHWRFDPDPRNSDAIQKTIYVTVHFTISAQ